MQIFRKAFIFLICGLIAQSVVAQKDIFKQGYYTFPIKPGQQNYLSAKMGELRSNHFHAGLDIKTDGREGLPTYAVADGYVYRIKVSSYGYGKALYIQHPNGQKSVYAHLQKFDDAIEEYVLQQQYAKESFAVNLFPPVGKFKFKQGDIIALAGNSGSSFGPHLHFEIRNQADEPLKVLKFGFSEITDNVSPEVLKVAVRSKNPDARIDGEYGRFEYPLLRTRSAYQVTQDIHAIGLVGIDIYAFDLANGVSNRYGIHELKVEVNGELVYHHELNQFSYNESRAIHTFIDYAHKETDNESFMRCYKEDGNDLSFYPNRKLPNGKILVEDGKKYDVKLSLLDVFGNLSVARLTLIGDADYKPTGKYLRNAKKNFWLDENALFFHKKDGDASKTAKVWVNGFAFDVAPSYRKGYTNAYVWDMRNGLPDSIRIGDMLKATNYQASIPSVLSYFHREGNFQFTFPKQALYDTLYLSAVDKGKDFSLCNTAIPLFKRIQVSFTPEVEIANKAKTRVYEVDEDGDRSYVGGYWKGKTIHFSTRDLGDFTLATDTIPPRVELLSQNSEEIKFRISDNLSTIDSYRATLDGKFLLMKFDHRIRSIWSERLDKSKPLKGKFRLEVTDEVGNKTVFERDL